MISKKIGFALLTASMAIGATAAQAQTVSTLGAIPAKAMSAEQMKQVEGKAHIYLLVEHRGVELSEKAEAATRAAAPTPKGGNFARSPSREATAFDFLN